MKKSSRSSRSEPAGHRPLRDDEREFIREIGSLLAPWGLPPSAGHVFGYLLLKQAPAGLDQIAAALEISKAGAWNAAQLLQGFGHIRRYGVPGSKRALYAPSDDFAAPLSKQVALLGALGEVLQNAASTIAQGQPAVQLRQRARFYLSMRSTMDEAIGSLHASREALTGS